MNKTHRVIWSDALHTFVVASEHASARGKPSSTRKLLATAVAMGMGGLLATQAMAAGSCPSGGLNTLGKPTSVMCSLAQGASLNVTAKGAITVSGPAVLIGPTAATATSGVVNNASLVRNGGQLIGNNGGYGILLEQTAVSGLIDNAASGVIRTDSGAGIRLRDSTLDGSVRNLGRIQAPTGTGIQVVDSQVAGNLDNRNAIAAQVGIGVQNSTVQGSILDRGNISSNAYAIDVQHGTIGGSIGVLGSAAGGQGAVRLSDSSVGGTVTNSGSLWSQQTALLLDNTLVKGNLGNSGSIAGSTGIKVTEGGFRSLSNSGRIEGNDAAVQISQAQVTGGLVNSGVLAIVAPNYANAPYANIGTALDVQLSKVAKDIVNSGTISGGSAGGSGVEIGGSVLGASLSNSGSVSGYDNGVHVYSSNLKGSIVNDGVITADPAATARNGTALHLTTVDVKGNVVNNGRLEASSTGLHLDRTLLRGDLLNTGLIKGDASTSNGVLLTRTDVDGALRNDGTLAGTSGLSLKQSTVSGGIANSGDISGVSLIGSKVQGIDNSGTIHNDAVDALDPVAGKGLQLTDSTVLSGGIRNSNVLLGSAGGLDILNSTVNGAIVNTGSMSADIVSGSGSDGFSVQKSTLNGGILNRGSLLGTSGLTVSETSVLGNIENAGKINGTFFAGLRLTSSRVQGNLVNSADGSIVGSNGIALGGSTITGQLINAGSLTGTGGRLSPGSALDVKDSVIGGGIVNSGTLTGTHNEIGYSTLGGFFNSGSINANTLALNFYNDTVTGDIVNTGTLAGTGGLDVSDSVIGGQVINSGDISGVSLSGTTLKGIDNSGTIHNEVVNASLPALGKGLQLTDSSVQGGGIRNSNALLGTSGGLDLVNSTVSGGIANTGSMSASLSDSSGNDGLSLQKSTLEGSLLNRGTLFGNSGLSLSESTVVGNIENAGKINGSLSEGLRLTLSRLQGDLVNSADGSITGTNGLSLGGSTITGQLINAGSLTGTGGRLSPGSALYVRDSLIAGGIVNSGSLTGNNNEIGTSTLGSFVNSGTINSNTTGVYFYNDKITGDIANSGTIAGTAGLVVNDSVLGGQLINSGDISGVGLTGSTVKGIDNSGVIHNDAVNIYDPAIGKGLRLANSTVLSGGIRNSNVLFGSAGGLDIVDSTVNGGIVNSGSMSADLLIGGNNGLSVQTSTLSGGIANSGRLFGSSGMTLNDSTVIGNIENSGEISGPYFEGVRLDSTRVEGDLINTATGSISGADGMIISHSTITGQLVNAGSVTGYGRRVAPGSGLLVTDSVIGGSIVNSGTLTGTITAINNSTIGGFVNSGTITNGYGLNFDNATIAGDIVNSGTIVGNGMDISKSVIGGQLINSGTISGRYYALHSLDGSVTRMTIAGNDTAAFIGDVSLPGASVNLAKAATYTLRNGNLFSVKDFTNNGTLRIASDANATIDGNYAQASDAVLSTEALNASTFGKLKVTGSATLPDQARFNVDVVDSGQSFSGARLNDVLSAGTLNSNGRYAVTSNSVLFDFSGVKDGNSVDLVAAPKSATAVTQALQGSGNLSAARALDSGLASNGGLTPFFVGATNSAQVASAVSQTLPSNAVAATQVSQSTLSTITDVVQSRIDANTGLASGDGFYGDKNLWMKPFGSWINQSERGGSPGYDASVYGMAFGVDAPVNELLRLGVSFSYANADTNSKADVSSQSAKVDLYQLMGYGSYTVAPNTELSFHAGVGQNRNDGERNINLNGIGGKASANYDSRSVTAGVALAKAFDISPTTRFIPSVRADYTWLQDDSYSEKGSAALQPLLLKVDKHQTDQLILGLDGKLSHEIVPGTQVTGNLGVGYDVIHDDSMLTSTYAGAPGQSFNTVGQSSSPWLARGGVGVSTRIASNGTELSVNYDGEVRTDFTNQTVSLKLKMPF